MLKGFWGAQRWRNLQKALWLQSSQPVIFQKSIAEDLESKYLWYWCLFFRNTTNVAFFNSACYLWNDMISRETSLYIVGIFTSEYMILAGKKKRWEIHERLKNEKELLFSISVLHWQNTSLILNNLFLVCSFLLPGQMVNL